MDPILSEITSKMTREEKLALVAELKAAIADEMASDALAGADGRAGACPRCGCGRSVRKGRGRSGEQRRLCRGCGRTWSAKTLGLLSRSKLPASAWMAFAECMADGLSLRESARRCGVSLYTAWFMRMRVCEVMAARTPAPRAGEFQVDELLVRENLSGNHSRSEPFAMPRRRHRNGQDGRRGQKGRSKRSFCVLCGVNELGDCFCALGERGAIGAGDAGLALLAAVPRGSSFVTDDNPAYVGATAGWAAHRSVKAGGPAAADINAVNALHSRLRGFLAPMHGVSARRLQRYLDWFCWREQFKRGGRDRRRLLFRHEAEGEYFYTRRITHIEPHPDYSWWVRQMSTVV